MNIDVYFGRKKKTSVHVLKNYNECSNIDVYFARKKKTSVHVFKLSKRNKLLVQKLI